MRRGFLLVLLLLGTVPFWIRGWCQVAPVRFPPDVYLITIDTLRPDHVGCYGYHQVETPALDALAGDGVRFTQAFTHSPITNTSHTTILTGLLPSVHGVTDFAIPLSAEHLTAAELLKKRGYHTAAFIGAVILDSNSLAPGLNRGFDFYDNFPKTASGDSDHNGGDNADGASISGSFKGKTSPAKQGKAAPAKQERWGRLERRGMVVVEHAEAWFNKHPGGPHFVWVHLYDPHDPYEPPPPYSEKYKTHLYDGEIAYADSALARWIAFLKKAGVYDNALIVVAGDHGEGLGEHGEETHGLFLYDSTLHIPLIVKMPAKMSARPSQETTHSGQGRVVDALVRTTDILPTILAITGTPAPAQLNGESLLPLIYQPAVNQSAVKQSANNPAPANRTLFSETEYPLRWSWAPLYALRTDTTKWIQAPRPELYDLKDDPRELKNLYAPGTPNAKEQDMQAEMAKWLAKLPPQTTSEKAETSSLPDPKDKIEVQNLLHLAMLASDDGRTNDARQDLEKALQLDPSAPTTLRQLGELESASGNAAKAAAYLKRAHQSRPDDSTVAFELGEALHRSGDEPDARDALEASLKLEPGNLAARLLLGRVYVQLKDPKNAEDQFEAALLVDPKNKEAQLGLAEANGHQQSNVGKK